MYVWDYKLTKNWQPTTSSEWIWYLQRKINYDDWRGLNPRMIKKFLPKLKIDPGKELMLKYYFQYYEVK